MSSESHRGADSSSDPNEPADGHARAAGGRPSGVVDALAYAVVVGALLLLASHRISLSWPIWALFLAPVVTAVAAYRLRETRRFGYGLVEMFVGACLAAATFIPQPPTDMRVLAGFLGSVYAMVRGLDNVGAGLEQHHPRAKQRWTTIWRF